jgi:manganese/zinc/iron transport system substrate-binding protein
MPIHRRTFLLTSLALLGSAGCGRQSTDAKGRLRIVTTTPMLGDLARRIAPDADTSHLFGEGVDPHLYKPTRSDIVELVGADVVVTNGLKLEGRMDDAFDRARASGRTVVAVGDTLPQDRLLHPEDAHGHPDPHVWMDPSLWSMCGESLADALGRHDSQNAISYSQAAKRFAGLATALEANARAAIDTVPKERRVLVTAHDAFGYFGRSFGLEVHAIQGISTESEAGLADVEGLVSFLVQHRVPAVFVESTVSPRTIQALIAGAKAQGHAVTIGGELFSDSMGPAGTPEGTWPGMLAHNVSTIVAALGGAVPTEGIVPQELRHANT